MTLLKWQLFQIYFRILVQGADCTLHLPIPRLQDPDQGNEYYAKLFLEVLLSLNLLILQPFPK
jgi:hypothetical protein